MPPSRSCSKIKRTVDFLEYSLTVDKKVVQ
nr:MAG TPA: hypothetical protein [Caudoviricetes sp.]